MQVSFAVFRTGKQSLLQAQILSRQYFESASVWEIISTLRSNVCGSGKK